MRIVALAAGVGNVRSVLRALDRVTSAMPTVVAEREIVATASPEHVGRADVLVVPGQGSFGAFAAALDGGLRDVLLDRIRAGTPYLGICLGLQILFEESDEAPAARGLAVLRGRVRRLEPGVDPSLERPRPLPHVGWNRAELARPDTPIVAPAHYYFAHSYAAVPEDPSVIATTTRYGDATFASAVHQGNVVGVQFHPEKSQSAGLAVIERFFARVAGGAG